MFHVLLIGFQSYSRILLMYGSNLCYGVSILFSIPFLQEILICSSLFASLYYFICASSPGVQ
ncbi:hypothetical protein OIU79_023564 [Salix purpurea]|uniref:Uncharacterized protein n=1 Tax=Salix purpurea TaxID=77065 RepID=A0A9Q0W9F0_SALPP|nr:hypothetical protein OIU79_023564 [Salix purpurea]